jgi:uncharacterized protein (DUF362 family)
MNSTVVVSHCPSYHLADIHNSIRYIFEQLDVPKSFGHDQRILIKPNLIAADDPGKASITHPAIIESVVARLTDLGHKPSIGDSPAFGSVKGIAKVTGLDKIARKYNVPLISFKPNTDVFRFGRESLFLHSFDYSKQQFIEKLSRITSSIDDFDMIINVPKLKAHVQMGITAATKNLYGLIAGKAKILRHFMVHNDIELFSLAILRIFERVRPEVTIVDAISTMEGHGPRHGEPTHRGVIVGGKNCLAVDAALTQLIGCQSVDNVIVAFALRYGFLSANHSSINLINPEHVYLKGFRMPSEMQPISFSLARVVKSCARQLLILFSEKSRKNT